MKEWDSEMGVKTEDQFCSNWRQGTGTGDRELGACLRSARTPFLSAVFVFFSMLGLRSAVCGISENTIFEHGGCLFFMGQMQGEAKALRVPFYYIDRVFPQAFSHVEKVRHMRLSYHRGVFVAPLSTPPNRASSSTVTSLQTRAFCRCSALRRVLAPGCKDHRSLQNAVPCCSRNQERHHQSACSTGRAKAPCLSQMCCDNLSRAVGVQL